MMNVPIIPSYLKEPVHSIMMGTEGEGDETLHFQAYFGTPWSDHPRGGAGGASKNVSTVGFGTSRHAEGPEEPHDVNSGSRTRTRSRNHKQRTNAVTTPLKTFQNEVEVFHWNYCVFEANFLMYSGESFRGRREKLLNENDITLIGV